MLVLATVFLFQISGMLFRLYANVSLRKIRQKSSVR